MRAPTEETFGTFSEPGPTSSRSFEAARAAQDVDLMFREAITSNLNSNNEASTRTDADAASAPDLEVITSSEPRKVGNNWIATYGLRFKGIDLSSRTDISSLYSPTADRSKFRGRNTPTSFSFDVSGPLSPSPDIAATVALEAAMVKLREIGVPVPELQGADIINEEVQIWVDPETRIGHLAWSLDLALPLVTEQESTAYRVWVEAKPGQAPAEVFEVEELVLREDYGVVLARVWQRTPLDGDGLVPLTKVRVTRQATSDLQSEQGDQVQPVSGSGSLTPVAEDAARDVAITDENGVFRFEGPSPVSTLQVELSNDHFKISNAAGAPVTLSVISDPDEGTLLTLSEGAEFAVAQHSAFYWANIARDFVGDVLTPTELLAIELLVNDANDCNASWESLLNRISLRRASPASGPNKCVNRAYRDTIFHEFGHAVDFAFGEIQNKAYSEGFGDSLAVLMKDNSCYGENSRGPGTCLRSAIEPIMVLGTSGSIHDQGRAYSGFNWELLEQLSQTYSRQQALDITRRLALQVALANPTSIENAILLTFDIDDDDLDLTNGTPHSRQITAAAKSRRIPVPDGLPQQ